MENAKSSVGYLGIGLMGAPMTRRLLDADYAVSVWNRSREKLTGVVEAGAIASDSPAAVARDSQIVFMCLTETSAVEQVVFGPDGVSSGAGPDKVLVDFSSIQPDATRAMAARLRDETGMGWVDAPVSGGVPGAEAGTLAIMAGGEAKDVEIVRPVVMAMCQRFTHMGDSGAGQVTKLCNQVIASCNIAVIAEAVALATKAGVDATRLTEALKGGFADSIPFQLFAPRMATGDHDPPLGAIYTLLKDADTARELARDLQTSVPMTSLAAELFRQIVAQGRSEEDPAALIDLYLPRSGKGKD